MSALIAPRPGDAEPVADPPVVVIPPVAVITTAASTDRLDWVEVSPTRWAARIADRHVGGVERLEERYVALDRLGNPIGVNGSLEGAQRRLDDIDLADPGLGTAQQLAERWRLRRTGWAPRPAR